MIYLTGDLHGRIDFNKLIGFHDKPRQRPLNTDDILIILGDFGLIWYNNPKMAEHAKDEKMLDRINSWGWTTLFLDGNHENHTRLADYPKIDKFGGKVGKIRDNIFHLKRGAIYTIESKKFFTFGGGLSIDKDQRLEGVSWWREELPTNAEMDAALGELEQHNNKIDYVLTHEAPRQYIPFILGKIDESLPESLKYKSPLAAFFEHLYGLIDFKHWYCGHYHEEFKKDKLTAMYKKIEPLECGE